MDSKIKISEVLETAMSGTCPSIIETSCVFILSLFLFVYTNVLQYVMNVLFHVSRIILIESFSYELENIALVKLSDLSTLRKNNSIRW